MNDFTVCIISDITMAVLSSECCDHNEFDDVEMNTYDDSKPRWMDSLRTRTPSTGKPGWKGSVKANSPSMRTYSEGGSLRTQRTRFELYFIFLCGLFVSMLQTWKQICEKKVCAYIITSFFLYLNFNNF